MVFNVEWNVQRRTFKAWARGIEALHLDLSKVGPLPVPSAGKKSTSSCWLFPEVEDGMIDGAIDERSLIVGGTAGWVDDKLNPEQKVNPYVSEQFH